jgi:hypothetical protein
MLATVLLASAMVLPPLPECISKAETLNQDGNEHFKRNLFDAAAQKYSEVREIHQCVPYCAPQHPIMMGTWSTVYSLFRSSEKSCPLHIHAFEKCFFPAVSIEIAATLATIVSHA